MVPALGPSGLDDSGRIVCGSPDPATGRVPAASIIPDCVPLNLFGGAGSITEEQLAYVIPRALINRGTNEQRLAEVVLSGPGGRMLGRDLQWVLGADYRREAGSLTLDPVRAGGSPFLFGRTADIFPLGGQLAMLTKSLLQSDRVPDFRSTQILVPELLKRDSIG